MMLEQDGLIARKWSKLLKYRPLFSYIPFVDFVLVAGSLAWGNVKPTSDFDVIIGARTGRIFTVRFFCILLFGMLGLRRRRIDHKGQASDKFCFNHFVTSASYTLRPPYNPYWQKLYKNLVPIYGKKEAVQQFFLANDWMRREIEPPAFDHRFQKERFNIIKKSLEFLLNGKLGGFFEKTVKKIQLRRIEKSLREGGMGVRPRLRYDDEELEFHPDTARIEEMLQQYKDIVSP